MSTICAAVKKPAIIEFINNLATHEVIAQTDNTDNIIECVQKSKPDILLVTGGLNGTENIFDVLLEVKKSYPKTRIVFLAGSVDFENYATAKDFDRLVNAGIYDIYCETKLSRHILLNLLDHPKDYEDVEYIHEYVISNANYRTFDVNPEEDDGYIPDSNNIIVFSSSKAGSGKSFISTNVAAMIARFGRPKADFQPPKVLIVEGDLQTLSVGTLFGLSNKQYTIRSALKHIRSIVSDTGEIIGDEETQARVREFIRRCCLPISTDIPNLFGMVGSSFPLEEINTVSPYHFFYLLGVVSKMFDVIIIDSNSALEHRTTGPVFQLARQIFMVVMDEYDSVKITNRYKSEFANLGIAGKTKYILNKYMTKAYRLGKEESVFDSEAYLDKNSIIAKVPYVDQVMAYNHIYMSKPLAFDESFDSLGARIAFTQIANNIWPMNNEQMLANEVAELEKSLSKKR